MTSEPIEIRLLNKGRRSPRNIAGMRLDRLTATSLNIHVVDAAFAALEATSLRCKLPASDSAMDDSIFPHQGVVQQLTSQLRALDAQRQQLARLLLELKTPSSAVI